MGLFTMITQAKIKERFTLSSDDFKHEQLIPKKFTCDAENVSPSLSWTHAPKGTVSFVLIVDDPDAPTKEPWVHWVAYNIPGKMNALKAGQPQKEQLNGGILQGKNTSKHIGYDGPCPPSGTHHYHFKLYALNASLMLPAGATKKEVESAMKGHVIGQAELIGLYKR